jgi:hypothetical protein
MSYNNRYTTKWNNWIEEAIFNEHINCYEYKDFYNFEEIGSGAFGKVYRANWKDSHNIYALKSLKDSEAKKFVDEVITIYVFINYNKYILLKKIFFFLLFSLKFSVK